MLAFCTSPSEISLVLGPSDARWLSEEMSFLAELYRQQSREQRAPVRRGQQRGLGVVLGNSG